MAKNLDFSQNYLQEPSINIVENETIVLSTRGDRGRWGLWRYLDNFVVYLQL